MFLSKLILNPGCRQVHVDLRSPYEMHRTLLRAFPDGLPASERYGVLWRVDGTRDGRRVVFVQSDLEPSWSRLPANYLSEAPRTRPRNETFRAGQVVVFRVRVNPTVKKKVPGKKNGRRIGLGKQEAERKGVTIETLQRVWLERKAAQGGFRVLSASSSPYSFQRSTKSNGEEEVSLSHIAVQFDGTLQVIDPELFRRTVATGIGSGKAFGFGLLSFAPV